MRSEIPAPPPPRDSGSLKKFTIGYRLKMEWPELTVTIEAEDEKDASFKLLWLIRKMHAREDRPLLVPMIIKNIEGGEA